MKSSDERPRRPDTPPEVEEMLASLYRPDSVEALFSGQPPSPRKRREVEEQARLLLERYRRRQDPTES